MKFLHKTILICCLLVNYALATDTISLDTMLTNPSSSASIDRETYRSEMQDRVQNSSSNENSQAKKTRKRLKDGTGEGSQNKGSKRGGGKS